MNGTSVTASVSLGNPGPSWHAVATGDFNGDGTSDILLQNSDAEIVIWGLSGGQLAGAFDVGYPGRGWQAIATGDLNGDGKSDILFRTIAAKSSFA